MNAAPKLVAGIRYFVLSVFISFFFLLATIYYLPSSAFAQTPAGQSPLDNATTSQPQYNMETNSDVPKNLHSWTQNVMIEVMSAFACQLAGIDPTTADHKCLGIDPKTGKLGYVNTNGGLLGFATSGIAYLYTPPAHASDYFRSLAANFGITKSAYAAPTPGYGFNALSPIQGLWSAFRNIVYLVFVAVFLIIGLAIMLRVKIDPRTVMTIQNQIPKIIIGIILVTFSYAIAGFLIDLMYATSYLTVGVIASADSSTVAQNLPLNVIGSTNPINGVNSALTHPTSVFQGLGDISKNTAGVVGPHLGDLFDNPTGQFITGFIGTFLGIMVGSPALSSIPFAGSIIGGLVGGFLGFALGSTILSTFLTAIAFLIIVVSIIAALFRLWFQLILAYVNILVDIIFAPFWIVAGLIPGSKINFSSWIRSLAANLAAFPAVLIMLTLARVFLDAFTGSSAKNYFVPPLIGNPGNTSEIGALIALGIILATPNVVKLMKTVFGAPQGGFGPVLSGVMGGVNIISTLGKPFVPRLYSRHWNPNTHKWETTGLLTPSGNRIMKRFYGNNVEGGGIINNFKEDFRRTRSILTRRGDPGRRKPVPKEAIEAVKGNPVEGPVPKGYDVNRFRREGETVKETAGEVRVVDKDEESIPTTPPVTRKIGFAPPNSRRSPEDEEHS